jgi:hypothetical protein
MLIGTPQGALCKAVRRGVRALGFLFKEDKGVRVAYKAVRPEWRARTWLCLKEAPHNCRFTTNSGMPELTFAYVGV